VLSVRQLSRRYATVTVVHELSFEVKTGEILGLLGPNGAGKSTTLKMICGALAPSGGTIEIAGLPLLTSPKRAKTQLGYLPEVPPLYPALTVSEYLVFCAKIRRIPRAQIDAAVLRVIALCHLESVEKRRLGHLSTGFKQRVGIAQAIVHRPQVIVLDEPTNGLDPQQMIEIRHLIKALREDHSVILSSHILSEVAAVCDRVLMLQQGRCVFHGSLRQVQAEFQQNQLSLAFLAPPDVAVLAQIPGVESCQLMPDQTFSVHTQEPKATAAAIIQASVQQGWQLYQIMPQQGALERAFMHHMGDDMIGMQR